MRSIIVMAMFLSISVVSKAQTKPLDSGQVFLKKADAFISKNMFDSASIYLNLSEAAHLNENDTVGYFESINRKSVIAYYQVDYDGSLTIAQTALSKMQEMSFHNDRLSAEFHRRIGVVYEVRDGNFSKAIELYTKGIDFVKDLKEKTFIQSQLQKDLAIAVLSLGHLDSAQTLLKSAVRFHEENFPSDHGEASDFYRILGLTYTFASNNQEAIKNFHKSLKINNLQQDGYNRKTTTADIYGNLAGTYQNNGYYDSAIYYYYKQKIINEKILAKNHRNLAYLYGNLSLLFSLKGYPDSAFHYSQKDLEINKTTLGEQHPDLALTYSKLSTILTRTGRYEESKIYAEKALGILERSFGKSHSQTFDPLFQLGHIHLEMKENDVSIEYFRKALKANQSGEIARSQPIVGIHLAIADNYFELGSLESALTSAKKAYEITVTNYGTSHETAGRARMRFGEYHVRKGNYQKSITEFEQARTIFIQNHGARNPIVSSSMLNMAKARLSMGQYQQGITLLQEAAIANSYSFDSKHIGDNPLLEDMIDPVFGINIVSEKAEALMKRFKDTGDHTSLLQSNEQYKSSVDLLAELVFETSLENDAILLVNNFHKSYQSLLHSLTEMKKAGIIETATYTAQTLKYSEESRSMSLIFNQFKALDNNALVANRDSLRFLNKEIGFAKSELLTANKNDTDSLKIRYYQNRLFELTNAKHLLNSNSQSNNSSYSEFRAAQGGRKPSQYQKQLSSNQAIIEFFSADSILYSIVITRDTINVLNTKLKEALSNQVQAYLSFKDNDLSNYIRGAHELYQNLIKPIEPFLEGKDKLTIVPDKELWNINFDLLLTELPLGEDARSFDYLIRKYQTSYAYSIDLLLQKKKRKRSQNGRMLAFAFEKEEENLNKVFAFRADDKSKITGTVSEIKNFDKNFSGDFFYGPKATEAEFKEKAENYSFIHLALHGDVDDKNFNASHLIFNRKNENTDQDGYLYPFELYDLDLAAELVVLSACHTGAGKITNGEGVMSIGRGFIYAGAKSILLSQWELSDATAPKIMKDFYEHLNNGHQKDQALRLAKLDFLESANNITANPLYWGSFFIVGETSQITLKHPFNWALWASIFGALLLASLVIRKRYSTSS